MADYQVPIGMTLDPEQAIRSGAPLASIMPGPSPATLAVAQNEATLSGINNNVKLGDIGVQSAQFQLQQAKEAWDLQKQQAANASQMAGEFLSQWTGAMGNVKDMYSKAFDAINSISGGSTSAGASSLSPELQGVLTSVQNAYKDFQSNYAPIQAETLNAYKTDLANKQTLTNQMMQLATPDYEGTAGRAIADVGMQSAAAREAAARNMMSLGVNPASGRFGALTRQSYLDEAKNKAIAANTARQAEKTRVAGLTTQGLSLINPSQTAQTAIDIANAGNTTLGYQADIAKAIADTQTARYNAAANMANTVGNLATGYSSAVVSPLSEFAGYYLGKSGGAITAPTTGTTGYTTPTTAIPTSNPATTATPSAGSGALYTSAPQYLSTPQYLA